MGFAGAQRKSPAFELASSEVLGTRAGMDVVALRSAFRATSKALDKTKLMDLASAALSNPSVEGACRQLWLLVTYVLDPALFPANSADDSGIDVASAFSDEANNDFIGSLAALPGVDRLPTHALKVSLLGRAVAPESERARRTRVLDVHRESEAVRNCIKFVAADPRPEAASTLARLLADPALGWWISEISNYGVTVR